MTKAEALAAAKDCFNQVRVSSSYSTSEAQAIRLKALAEAGRGYLELAKELRQGT